MNKLALVSVVVPAFDAEEYLRESVESVLAQTHRELEVVVVNDGSRDRTLDVALKLQARDDRVAVLQLPHGGPSEARNVGLAGTSGDFVMFLDADDVIAPEKIDKQLTVLALRPDVEMVLCDVAIVDGGKRTTAAERYGYGSKRPVRGDLGPALEEANFIPIMSPLVRGETARACRFPKSSTHNEDWWFWKQVAARGPAEYVPEVLATYRKRAKSWSRRGAERVLLNLGCGTAGVTKGGPIKGMVNLDKSTGWTFEGTGLQEYADGSVDGITISHALMFVDRNDWVSVFADLARALRPGGVLRVTEDDTVHPESRTRGGWRGRFPAVSLTSPGWVLRHMRDAGLDAREVGREETAFEDGSLLQAHYGDRPHVFFVEGVKR